MIEHIVLFKFEEQTTKEQQNEAIKRLTSLRHEIPGIIDIQAGLNFSDRNKGYELGLTVRFEDKEALEQYGPHEKHQEVVAYLKEIGLSDILVVDFEM
ncbi:Dabb family protein [Pontibacillus sp. ALD_SL1]|uniref:Dabb family protein n=1 Tax=Pontibacillus sp. ALD_SL1 TaxID=2777185 RepID=UPI001A96FF65|nr:Dabb family protein [Pontibacillus sp. ALD_SL1]QST01740.1 Dabb family protein [Pontibacillus sp. ALD_SL1]